MDRHIQTTHYTRAMQTVADFYTQNKADYKAEIPSLLVSVKELYFSEGKKMLIRKKENLL